MKQNRLIYLLLLEALLCLCINFIPEAPSNFFQAIASFPFMQIATGLRNLSLSGFAGNIIAFIIYVLLCLIPIGIICWNKKNNNLHKEDLLLIILSISLFVGIYLTINSTILFAVNPLMSNEVTALFIGCILYSIITAYIVLRIVRLFSKSNTNKLHKYLIFLLYFLNIIFIYIIFGLQLKELIVQIESYPIIDSSWGGDNEATHFVLVLNYIMNCIPYVLMAIIISNTINLLNEVRIDRYSEKVEKLLLKLSSLCKTSLIIIVISILSFNLIQLIFVGSTSVINVTFQIPVLSITLILFILLFTQYQAENQKLKQDNDMFI